MGEGGGHAPQYCPLFKNNKKTGTNFVDRIFYMFPYYINKLRKNPGTNPENIRNNSGTFPDILRLIS